MVLYVSEATQPGSLTFCFILFIIFTILNRNKHLPMKLPLFLICTLLPAIAGAQISLTAGDYTRTIANTYDSVRGISAASIPAMTMGANQLWDFSAAVYDTAWQNVYHRAVPSPGVFPSAQFADSTTDTVSFYGYAVKKMRSVTAAGIVAYGEHCDRQTFTLEAGSLNNADSMTIDPQDIVYTTPITQMPLPLTYSASWKTSTSMVTKFHVLANALGFNNAPGEFDSQLSTSDSVSGWGTIRITPPGSARSYDIDVLQVRSSTLRLDYPFVNGTALDFNQEHYLWIFNGNMEQTFEYRYYRKGEVTPLVTVSCIYGFNTITGAKINVQRLQTAIAGLPSVPSFHVYPNPVVKGSIYLDAANAYPVKTSVEVYSALGQKVLDQELAAGNKRQEIKFPASIAPGTYYLRLISNSQVIYQQSIAVNR